MFGTNTFGQSSRGQTNNVNSNPFAPTPFVCTSMPIDVFGAQSSSQLGSTCAPSSPAFAAPLSIHNLLLLVAMCLFHLVHLDNLLLVPQILGLTLDPLQHQRLPSFVDQNTSFRAQATNPLFGSSGFGGQRGGSRVSPYSATPETNGATASQPPEKLESISAMPFYKDKSHEELRWEDYQLGDKGGPAPSGQATAAGFGTWGFRTTAAPAFGQSSANPFSQKTPGFGIPFGTTTSTPAFGSSPFETSNTSSPFRVYPYSATPGKLESMSAVLVHKDKSHEQLRCEDYQLGDKVNPAFGQSADPFSSTNPFAQRSPEVRRKFRRFKSKAVCRDQPTVAQSSSPISSSPTTSSLTTPFQSALHVWNSGGFGATPSISSSGASGQILSWKITKYRRVSVETQQGVRRWTQSNVEILESICYRSGIRRV